MIRIRQGLAALGAASLLAVGGVAVTATAAFATHPTVTGVVKCDTKTGTSDITWTVRGDTSYPNETATIKTQSISTSPTLVGKSVKNDQTVSGVQSDVSPGNHTQTVKVQWTNHREGDLVSASGSVSVSGDCQKPDKKIEICHRDQGKPEWKEITISESALPAHLAHQWGADKYPVPSGGCDSLNVTKVPLPADQKSTDACNPVGVTDNVAWKDSLPADTDRVNWSESSNGNTRTASLKGENVEWSDGTTAPKVFKLPADSGVKCVTPPTDTEITVPTVPVVDECGVGNAHYGDVPSGNYTVVRNEDGSITLTAKDGYVFPDGKKSVTLPAPEETNTEECTAPTAPVCAQFSGFPEGSVYVIRALYKSGATVAVGPFDVGSDTSVDVATTNLVSYTITVYGPAPDYKELYASGPQTLPQTECLVIKPPVTPPTDTEITVPTVPVVDECGVGNAHYGDVPSGNYTVVRNEDGSITLTAKDGYVFPDGKKSVTLPKPEEKNTAPCPTDTPKVTAVNGSFADKCGTKFNLTFTPAVTKGVKYVQTRQGNTLTVRAYADKGYVLTNPNWTQSMTDKLVACPKPPVVKPPVAKPPVVHNPPSRGIGANTGLDDTTQPSGLGGLRGILLAAFLMGLVVLNVLRIRTQPATQETGRHCKQ